MMSAGWQSTASSAGTLCSIQYLRAFAAYMVVFFHLTATLNNNGSDVAVFNAGAIGVDIFFVLSGFLMAMIVEQRREVDGEFLLRRIIRIVPLYYAVTCAVFILAAYAPALFSEDRLDFARLAASFLFVPYVADGGAVTPILSLGWTLNYEMFFYCVIALTTKVFNDRKLRVTTVALCGLVAVGQVWDLGPVWQFYTDPIILEFAAGIVIYHYVYAGRKEASPLVSWLILAGGVAAMMASSGLVDGSNRLIEMGLPAMLVVTGGIYALSFRPNWLKSLGDWSYSTYLIHIFVIHIGVAALGAVNGDGFVIAGAVIIPAIVVSSALLFKLFEVPVVGKLRGLLVASSADRKTGLSAKSL